VNIFVLDRSPIKAAIFLADDDLFSVVLKSAQIMLAVRYTKVKNRGFTPYYPEYINDRFINHPCTQWVGLCKENYRWLLNYTKIACCEYSSRFGRSHITDSLVYDGNSCSRVPPLPDIEQTPFVVCVPNEFKTGDAIESYRRFYKTEKNKIGATWHGGENNRPSWWGDYF
jgi:hypothetical protein